MYTVEKRTEGFVYVQNKYCLLVEVFAVLAPRSTVCTCVALLMARKSPERSPPPRRDADNIKTPRQGLHAGGERAGSGVRLFFAEENESRDKTSGRKLPEAARNRPLKSSRGARLHVLRPRLPRHSFPLR